MAKQAINACRVQLKFGLTLICSLFSFSTFAAETFVTETLHIENRSPVIQLYTLPRPMFNLPLKQGSYAWQSRVEIANYLSSGYSDGNYLFIDGETWIFTNSLRHQLSENASLQLSAPLIRHGKGFTDRFIFYFHEVFQLPQNGRTSDRHNRMNWRLSSQGTSAIDFDESKFGFGDLTVKLSWKPANQNTTELTAHLKLPTGNFAKHTGSENIDAGLSILGTNPGWLKDRKWLKERALSLWYGAGFGYIGHTSELSAFDPYPFVLTVQTGIAWSVSKYWKVKAQFDSNSPLFNSNIRELGWIPVQISLATEHNVSPDTTFDFMITEDLRPRVTPDITFSAGFNVRY